MIASHSPRHGARSLLVLALLLACSALLAGCGARSSFFGGPDPFGEETVFGRGRDKAVLINVNGVIDNRPKSGLFRERPGMVQEVVAQLRLAAQDPDVKAVLVAIDSPGGGVTASDVLYHELMRHRERTGQKVVALMMDTAASGGYYTALAADRIVAHPSTVTGSIGVIFLRPEVAGLMDKIGVRAVVSKSGDHKDMGSPFREGTDEERALFQSIIADMNGRFQGLVRERRPASHGREAQFADARILTARQALAAGLVDRIGYFEDALAEAASLTGATELRVVTYRRDPLPGATEYATATTPAGSGRMALVDLGLPGMDAASRAGFHYLWLPEAGM
ncbi:signal peptide peptidase SppA [Nitratidesulfovibrio sp. D1]|uniref:signal peptide peptidase SppA n=1 Tax=Nitratidesulfovibrio sp. D1 TaxID=3440151 RepID=UPI003EBC1779